MKSQGILQNRRFITLVYILGVISIVYIGLNIFLAARGQDITALNDITSILFSLASLGFFINVWLSTEVNDLSKQIWGQIILGLISWSIAEIIWAYYEVILGTDTPYPSIADLFWFLGYAPFFWALVIRYKSLHVTLNRNQKSAIAFSILLFISITIYFIFKPILTEFDPQRLVESLLNVIFPLADLGLLILAVVILFSFGQGRFTLTWRMIVIGLIMRSVSDLLFSYLSWYGLYYPEGQANTATILVDTVYNLSYLLLGLGIYAYGLLLEIKHTVKLSVDVSPLTQSKVLVFINARNQIISFSDNFMLLVEGTNKAQYDKMSLSQALGVDDFIFNRMIDTLLKQGSVRNYSLTMGGANSKAIFLTAVALFNPQKEYEGAGLVLTANLSAEHGEEPPLTREQADLVQSFLERTGAGTKEDAQVLKSYFVEQVKLLYSLAYEFNGQYVADSLLAYIAKQARENAWDIKIDGQQVSIPEEYEGQMLVEALSVLLEKARAYISNSVSLSLVEQEMEVVDQSLSQDVLQTIDKYEFRSKKLAVA